MIQILLTIALAGFIVWLILKIPMPSPFPEIIIGVVCVLLVLWALQLIGVNTRLPVLKGLGG